MQVLTQYVQWIIGVGENMKWSIWIASVPALSHPSESRIRLCLRGRQFVSCRRFLSFFTWCASASQHPLLNVCVLVVPHHRRSPPNPLYRPRVVSPSPRLLGTSGREKSPAVFPRSADSQLCPPLPLPSRPKRGRRRERVWKCEERGGESRWNERVRKRRRRRESQKGLKLQFRLLWVPALLNPSVWCTKHLTWTLLCFSSS